jgi:MerR family transcriptional regulator, light-induced transcriptional regulator
MQRDAVGARALHPIGVVAERTGLTPDVLRVWERRYAAVAPERARGGQRLYTDGDIERLVLLRRATEGGRGIGTVVGLTTEELAGLVREDQDARLGREEPVAERIDELEIERAIQYARDLDGERLEGLLRRSAALSGAPRFLERTVGPLLQRVGEEWHAGRVSVAQEHLTTVVVQRVVISVLGSLNHAKGAPVLLVSGPAGERHGMGGLLAAAVGASEGWKVVYLGPDLPASEIVAAAKAAGARAVGLSVVYVGDPESTLREIRSVREGLPGSVPLLVGGAGARGLEPSLEHPAIHVVGDLEILRRTLGAWKAESGR